MTPPVIVDTGPLVALLNRRDRWHAWAVEQFGELGSPLATCESVLAESSHLLRHDPKGPDALLQLISRGLLSIDISLQGQAEELRRLMWRYRDLPMSLADACLVKLAEQASGAQVLTLDAHFRRYRRHGRHVIPLILPSDGKKPDRD